MATLGSLASFDLFGTSSFNEVVPEMSKRKVSPRAITMWDFSWLEPATGRIHGCNGQCRQKGIHLCMGE